MTYINDAILALGVACVEPVDLKRVSETLAIVQKENPTKQPSYVNTRKIVKPKIYKEKRM